MCIRDSYSISVRAKNAIGKGPPAEGGVTVPNDRPSRRFVTPVSYTHLRAHETPEHLVCRLLLEKKKKIINFFFFFFFNDTATTEIYTRSLVGSVRCV